MLETQSHSQRSNHALFKQGPGVLCHCLWKVSGSFTNRYTWRPKWQIYYIFPVGSTRRYKFSVSPISSLRFLQTNSKTRHSNTSGHSAMDSATVSSSIRCCTQYIYCALEMIQDLTECHCVPQSRPSSKDDTPYWTTNSGAPVFNNNQSLTAGVRGATCSSYAYS